MKAFSGEIIGTFILVFVGLSAVVNAAIIEVYSGLFQVAMLWGFGLMIAIFVSAPMSGAHLNPAITLAFAFTTDFRWKSVMPYIVAQSLGALLASCVVYLLYGDAITSYEAHHGILRGSEESVRSAMVFGEFFPNPASCSIALGQVDCRSAFFAEAFGTAFLAFVIFTLIKLKELPNWVVPIFIGLTLTVLISLLAPISMAGFNPARDFIPRLFSNFAGWGTIPFSANGSGWLNVYIIAPIIGAIAGAFLAKWNSTADS